jgi:hypothetical protein
VRHFCWTANKAEKMKRLKQFDVLMIQDDCYNDLAACFSGGKSTLEQICLKGN